MIIDIIYLLLIHYEHIVLIYVYSITCCISLFK
nr:MAG TPA: hypothetical protein [Caudoviricetes sp.]